MLYIINIFDTIFGKIAKDLLDGNITEESVGGSHLIIGFVAAFLSGLVACTWMISLVRKSKLSYFSIYCFIVGIFAIAFGYFA